MFSQKKLKTLHPISWITAITTERNRDHYGIKSFPFPFTDFYPHSPDDYLPLDLAGELLFGSHRTKLLHIDRFFQSYYLIGIAIGPMPTN